MLLQYINKMNYVLGTSASASFFSCSLGRIYWGVLRAGVQLSLFFCHRKLKSDHSGLGQMWNQSPRSIFLPEIFKGVGWSRVWKNHGSRVRAVLQSWLGKAWRFTAVTGTIGPSLTLDPFLISLYSFFISIHFFQITGPVFSPTGCRKWAGFVFDVGSKIQAGGLIAVSLAWVF